MSHGNQCKMSSEKKHRINKHKLFRVKLKSMFVETKIRVACCYDKLKIHTRQAVVKSHDHICPEDMWQINI